MTSISIIIPVYNVEEYVDACIKSVIAQTYTGPIECIIVDDCGNDRSMEIVKQIITPYSGPIKFRIIAHDQNRGLSAARNTGIKNATGEYLYFLDSDDEITPTAIASLTEPFMKDTPDIVIGEFKTDGEDTFRHLNISGNQLSVGKNCFNQFISGNIYEMAWNKLVNRKFILKHKLYFEEQLLHEDMLWSFFLFYHSTKIITTKNISYIYRVRNSGIIGNMSEKNLTHLIRIFDTKFRFIINHDLFRNYTNLYRHMLSNKAWILECCNKYNQSNSLYNDVRKRMPWHRSYGYRRSIKESFTAIMLSLGSRSMSLLLRLK